VLMLFCSKALLTVIKIVAFFAFVPCANYRGAFASSLEISIR